MKAPSRGHETSLILGTKSRLARGRPTVGMVQRATERPTRIEYVGHATALLDLDGIRILTDPLLRLRVLHLRRTAELLAEPPRDIDKVLISHPATTISTSRRSRSSDGCRC